MITSHRTSSSHAGLFGKAIVYRLDLWLSLGLFVITVLTRLPLRSQTLYHWDSVNFAYGLEEFDVARGQPHAPGYIGYIWIGRLINALFADPQSTFVWLSIAGSSLAVVGLYLLGRSWCDRRVGLIAALFLASSPLFWFYGEIALPHALDTFFVIVSVWMLFKVMRGDRKSLIPAAVVMATAGALRQQTPVFLTPLAIYAGYLGLIKPLGWRKSIKAVTPSIILFGILCSIWFFPLIKSAGGLVAYQETVGNFTQDFNTTTSIFIKGGTFGLARNLRKLVTYTLYACGAAVLPLMAYGIYSLLKKRCLLDRRRAGFLMMWIVPSLVFYTLIHMGQQGLVFVFLPALLLLSAEAIVHLLNTASKTMLVSLTVLLLLCNAGVFLFLPEYPLQNNRFKLLTHDTIVNQDLYLQDRVDALHKHFPPEQSLIVAANWRHVMFYLPEYTRLPYEIISKWELGEGEAKSKEKQTYSIDEPGLFAQSKPLYVVLFDPSLQPFNRSMEQTAFIPLSGDELAYLELDKGESLTIDSEGIRVIQQP